MKAQRRCTWVTEGAVDRGQEISCRDSYVYVPANILIGGCVAIRGQHRLDRDTTPLNKV